ncbi:aluminum-activated malate transporter family protein [Marchantia polymorpha subsp. ruderalis]|uniref:Uncharacterized protein n=2 Tax=Marchantia polymorpha TaxID=3197 RepID=A0AAF6AWF5_MARPO|nr:hypothetical protein MARPO_0007s0172 [Marchantia polymorpha]BBN04089.1 hypothetical protein Mp_3g01810 [Marchantia polymorpha subsp. ruderalis]|eukprot:PTQ47776.1 hypothetical protein MARPO_0007s0172 [Marchantia polymorpha]
MRTSELQGAAAPIMGYTKAEKKPIPIPGMSDYHRDEFHPSSVKSELQVPPSLKDEFYIPPSLRNDFSLFNSNSARYTDCNTPRNERASLAINMPLPTGSNWAHDNRIHTAASSCNNRFSPPSSSWTGGPEVLGQQNQFEPPSRAHSIVGDADQEIDDITTTNNHGMDSAARRRLLRNMSRSSMAGIARSSSVYAPKKSRSEKLKDYVQYEKGILESLLPLKAAVAATTASIISFLPILPDMLRYYGTTAVVGVGMTLEPTVGQTLQKGYNLALGSLLAACCAFAVFKVEPYTGGLRVPFLILCAFLGGCLPRMYNLPAVIKSRWGQVVSYYISVFHGLVLWNPLAKKQTSQFLFNCMCYSIGFLLSFSMGLCIKPDYAGDILLSLLVRNFHTAGSVLERIVEDYKNGLIRDKIQELLHNVIHEDKIHSDLQFIMSSIPEADKLVTAVQWEPVHGKFYSGYPWSLYPKLLDVLLHVMYDLLAMDSCLRGEIQAQVHVRQLFAEDMEEVARECATLFHKIGDGLEQHKMSDYQIHVAKAKDATRRLRAKLSRFSALVIAQDSAPAYSRSTSISSSRGDAVAAAVDSAVLANDMGAATMSTPVSPQKSERNNDADLDAVPTLLLHQDSVADDWRTELNRRQMSAQQEHWISVQAHWEETSQRISSLSFLKFASILIELMAKVKTVVAVVDDFAQKAKFSGSTSRH